MIKFSIRHNFIYILLYILWSFLRNILIMFMDFLFKFNNSYIYIHIMFLGELFGGTITYFYQKKYNTVKKEEKKDQYSITIKLIKSEVTDDDYFSPLDSKIKIIFLILLLSLFDTVEFILVNIYLPRFINLSPSLYARLYGIATISAFVFYIYALKLPVFRHHKFSLLIISICLLIIIATEFYYQKFDIFLSNGQLGLAITFIAISQILCSCMDSIEKYLFEYDYMNPFVVLMYEGFFGFFISFIVFIDSNYFHDMALIYNKSTSIGNFILFIFLLIVYMILSAGKNLYRIFVTKIYNPMVKTLQDYLLNPIYLIYYFGAQKDFMKNKELDIAYFILNIIISLIISFFGCIYNEFIILFFCDLERDTHDQISKRAEIKIKDVSFELFKLDDFDETSYGDDIESIVK